ncbi:MAG: MBL fold metallo-hydrolase [Anaerolineales bacterium]|nr:MAG: MBL fold metallo-hydrolase [Anaerolineales bacterium]
MRKIKKKIYIESKFVGVQLGMVVTKDGLLLIDCPLKVEDTKEWFSLAGEYGIPRYLALLDAHPDRVLGARAIDIPLIAQDRTLETIREWADTYKGGLHPIGAEADRLKRITGVQRAAPEIMFSSQMQIHLGEIEFHFLHRPGPRPGSTWILLPNEKIAFVGDAVAMDEPPYLGAANLKRWIDGLDELRGSTMESYTILTSQGGPINRDDINAMARFLRKVEHRLEKSVSEGINQEQSGQLAAELMDDFQTVNARQDQALLRLQAGLLDLVLADRQHP